MKSWNFSVCLLGQLQLISATPITETYSAAAIAQAAQRANEIDLAVIAANECKGQSCHIADVTGSTGRTPQYRPEGANDGDIACIVKYNPELDILLKQGTMLNVTKQDTGVSSQLMGWLNGMWRPYAATTDTGDFTGTCAKNILIFAKGTMEPTAYGITVGPLLTTGLGDEWSTAPVPYFPDVPGDYCLGLPGGMVAKDVINKAAALCPTSNIFVSGYSQGAMVARIGVAYANDSARAKVKGVITFGDPFQGAPIKGYKGALKEYCKPDDGVCTGNFEVAVAHLSYPFDGTVEDAQAELKRIASAGA